MSGYTDTQPATNTYRMFYIHTFFKINTLFIILEPVNDFPPSVIE